MGWDGMGWDGMGWDGMGWDGMGWDGMGWDGRETYVAELVCQDTDSRDLDIRTCAGRVTHHDDTARQAKRCDANTTTP
jgi:hypothetical protein